MSHSAHEEQSYREADAIYPTPAATTMIAPTDVDDLAEVLADG